MTGVAGRDRERMVRGFTLCRHTVMAGDAGPLQHARVVKRRGFPGARRMTAVAAVTTRQVGRGLARRLVPVVARDTSAQNIGVINSDHWRPSNRAVAIGTGIGGSRVGRGFTCGGCAIMATDAVATNRLAMVKAPVLTQRSHRQAGERADAGSITLRPLTADGGGREAQPMTAAHTRRGCGRGGCGTRAWRCLVTARNTVLVTAGRAIRATTTAHLGIRCGWGACGTTDVVVRFISLPDRQAVELVPEIVLMAGVTGIASRRAAHIADRPVTHDRAGERGDHFMAPRTLHRYARIGDGNVQATGGHLHDRKTRSAGKWTLPVRMTGAAGGRHGAMQLRQVRRVDRVITRRRVAGGAGRALIDRNVIGWQRRPREVRKAGTVTTDAITRCRMGRILDLVGTTRRIGSGLETHVLRRAVGRQRGRRDWILRHRHPGIAAFVAALAVRRHAGVDLRRVRRWR